MNARPDKDSRSADDQAQATGATARRRLARGEWFTVAALVLCLAAGAGLTRWLELRRPPLPTDAAPVSEDLYVSAHAARRLALGFNGLAADWYWMRALQYVGRKATAHEGDLQIDDLGPLKLRALAPLLEQATTLDPQFLAAYEYGAIVLPSVDDEAAVRLVEKGVRENPRAWRLHSYLGYIHWQRGRFREAAEAYSAGARVEGAPPWMTAMAAQMSTKGGSRETARAIYEVMLRTTDDEQMKLLAFRRLVQLQSLDEQDALRRLLNAQRERAGRCAADWRELAPTLRAARLNLDASGSPLDPLGVPYKLLSGRCDVELGERSEVLRNY
jgi:tetratricopeptide (TPR) repeat protein